jgi:hypothetical protein
MESSYWMLGQYDGLVIFELPDAQTAAALSLAVTRSGAFSRFETHQLIEASDLAQIAERSRSASSRQAPDKQCPPRPLALAAPPQVGCADLATPTNGHRRSAVCASAPNAAFGHRADGQSGNPATARNGGSMRVLVETLHRSV